MNRLIITSFLFCLLGVSIYPKMLAQEATSAPEPGLSLICRYVEGNILLRWAPANPAVWTDGQRHGYQIERLEFDSQDGPDLTKFQPLHTAPIRPLSLTEFQNLRGQQPQNDYLAAMAECLYGEGPLAQGMSGDWLSAADDHLNRYSFALFTAEMDFEAAQAAGWALVDEDIIPGKTYLYQVRLAQETSIRPAFAQVSAREEKLMIPQLSGVSEEESRVLLHWNRLSHERHFSAYHIERSGDGETFARINALPYVHGLGQDQRLQTTVISYPVEAENYRPAYYRIRGVNAFGQMSEPSEAVRAMGRDRTPPAAPTQVQSEPDPHAVKVLISWEMEDLAGDIAGFAVRRSFDYQGELLPLHPEILPPHTRQFVDEQPNYVGINYYQVVALDTAGNEAYSQVVPGYIEDLKPPQKPTGLEGSIDSLGIVRLSWNPNPDPDIKGYKVFFANTQTEVFNALTNKAQAANRYQDTIAVRTLSHKIHYRLVAVDARGNLSPFSDILTLERPDVIPPAQALFRDYEVVEGAIALHWIPSSSEDAAKMVLYRQKNDGPWESVRSFLPQHSSYLDEDIDPGVIYRYQLEVSDQAQNRARSKVLEVQSRKAQIALEGRLRIQKQEESLQLRWQSPQEPVSRWVLYRGVETGPMVTLSSVPPGEHQFEDRNLKAGLRYRYAVRAVYADGRKSPLSNTVEGILN